MKAKNSYRKFQKEQQQIETLERNSARFKRVYTEYETLSDDLWQLESSGEPAVTDVYLDSVRMQQKILEDEVQNWLDSEKNLLQ